MPLDATPRSGSRVESYELAGDRVFYRGELVVSGVVELEVAPLDASQVPLLLNDPLATSVLPTDVTAFALSPDGEWAVYSTTTEVFAAPLASPSDVRRLFPATEGCTIDNTDLAIDAGSTRAAFRVDSVSAGGHVFSAPLDGSSPAAQLSRGRFAFGFGNAGPRFSPDGARVVFSVGTYNASRARGSLPRTAARSRSRSVASTRRSCRAPLDGSGPAVELSGPLGLEQDVLPGFVIVESATSVVFLADLAADDQVELWLAPLDGSRPATRRCELALAAGDVQPGFRLTPDERDLVYRADEELDELVELFLFPVRRAPFHAKR